MGGELLTSTESIARQWKVYFEDLLSSTNMHSKEEAELKDFGLGSHISVVSFTGADKQLRNGSAPRVEEIRPKLMKALDVVG